jgi:hypothetical protein
MIPTLPTHCRRIVNVAPDCAGTGHKWKIAEHLPTFLGLTGDFDPDFEQMGRLP